MNLLIAFENAGSSMGVDRALSSILSQNIIESSRPVIGEEMAMLLDNSNNHSSKKDLPSAPACQTPMTRA